MSLPPVIPIRSLSPNNQATKGGREIRFKGRFVTASRLGATEIKHIDEIGIVADKFATALASLKTQEQNITELTHSVNSGLAQISDFQTESGERQVHLLPTIVLTTPLKAGDTLGLIQEYIEFTTAGLLHFMEEVLDLKHELKLQRKAILEVASYNQEFNILGQIVEPALQRADPSPPITETRNDTYDSDDE
jgi:hypothetical protein